MNEPQTVLVIGGGIAGLSAARELARHGFSVTLLEAASRLGGRIFTFRLNGAKPVELGAEFVHGCPPDLWRLLKAIPLATREVDTEHYISELEGALKPFPFEDELE